jgi:spermidine/putrescine transport system substrate-binding protein
MMANNPDLDFVIPKEGSNKFVDSICIPKNAPNVENAEKFINFLLSAETAKANAEFVCYTTPNKAAYDILDEDYKSDDIIYPAKEDLDKCFYFSSMPKDIYNYLQQSWIEVKM